MCVNCEKKMLNIYRQGKTFTDQFYVDEDYNVPDTKADIREIIESDAVMEEIDLKLVENYIRITGRLAFQVLYVADNSDNTLSSLEGKIPFVCTMATFASMRACEQLRTDIWKTRSWRFVFRCRM